MRANGIEGAREVLPPSRLDELGEIRKWDSWVLNLWNEMHSPIARGGQFQLLAFRSNAAGLRSEAQQLEVWERVSLVESVIVSHLRGGAGSDED